MSKIVSVVNQKGGVGKTTTTINLAGALAEMGYFVLLVDLDPQANATSGLGIEYRNLEYGIYNTLIGDGDVKQIMIHSKRDGLKIAPAHPALAGANIELVNHQDREFKLLNALDQVRPEFDIILVDCPPSLGLLTINGLVAAEHLLIPVQAEYYALEGLGQLLSTVELIKDNLKPDLDILGAIVTMYDRRNKISKQVLHELKLYFPYKVFQTVIPRNVRLTEAPSHGLTIFEYDSRSKGAKAYRKLAQEIVSQLKLN